MWIQCSLVYLSVYLKLTFQSQNLGAIKLFSFTYIVDHETLGCINSTLVFAAYTKILIRSETELKTKITSSGFEHSFFSVGDLKDSIEK